MYLRVPRRVFIRHWTVWQDIRWEFEYLQVSPFYEKVRGRVAGGRRPPNHCDHTVAFDEGEVGVGEYTLQTPPADITAWRDGIELQSVYLSILFVRWAYPPDHSVSAG